MSEPGLRSGPKLPGPPSRRGRRRTAVRLPENPVTTERGGPGRLPLVVRPNAEGLDLADWAAGHTDFIEDRLAESGGLFFRGFHVDSVAAFERLAAAVCRQLYDQNGEHTNVSGHVQTPVAYAADKKLLWHNENSFNESWPRKILFCCQVPAAEGGETPIVDSREVFARLPPELREPFIAKKILYVRNYSSELGRDWQTVFRTDSRAEVEARCRAARVDFTWKSDGTLRTRAVRPAVLDHPRSGETSWFNQAQHWHVSCLDAATRRSLEAMFAEEDLPRNCYYGDGSPISDATMEEILRVYRELEITLPWQRGDVMVLDNVHTAHARNPYRGDRRILVALGDMMNDPELDAPR